MKTEGMWKGFLCVALLGCLTCVSKAETYLVLPDGSGDFPTILEAVDAASDGDIIELGDGTFTGDGCRNVDYQEKAITIRSQSGSYETCVIDLEGEGYAFGFRAGETLASRLEGVTITNGAPAVIIQGQDTWFQSSGTIEYCRFLANHADVGGALRVTDYAVAEITECLFESNTANHGGAIEASWAGVAHIDACEFYGNTASTGGALYAHQFGGFYIDNSILWYNEASEGGAAYIHSYIEADHCLFVRNQASNRGGAMCCLGGLAMENCTLAYNTGPLAGGVYFEELDQTAIFRSTVISHSEGGAALFAYSYYQLPDLECCDFFGNEGGDYAAAFEHLLGTNGNISSDPHYCDPDADDFTVRADSPCAGTEDCQQIGALEVGCDAPQPAIRMTWGHLKRLFE